MGNLPRGIRNNNPGNIRWSRDTWKGLIPRDQAKDQSFCEFRSPEYGIRAMVRILRNYTKYPGINGVGKPNIDTVREIIHRWAPPNENNTEAYIQSVAAKLGVSANTPIDVFNTATMLPLLKAIIMHENGQQPYTDAVITSGINLA
ncbi:MAG: structural protein [Leifsonia xyli]|nr:MAG: structural protein [Leifsonia xyli]